MMIGLQYYTLNINFNHQLVTNRSINKHRPPEFFNLSSGMKKNKRRRFTIHKPWKKKAQRVNPIRALSSSDPLPFSLFPCS